MRKRDCLLILILFCLYWEKLAYSSTIYVPPDKKDALTNAVIASNSGDILILSDGGTYPITASLPVNVALTIKTVDGAAVKSRVVFAPGASGQYPKHMINANASITLKNIIGNGQQGTLSPYYPSWFINRGSIGHGKIHLDGVEVSRFSAVSTGASVDTLIAENCLFNGCLTIAGGWGGTFDFTGVILKYVRIQNNTFMFCIFGPCLHIFWSHTPKEPQLQTLIIDHNTFYNITGAHGPTTMISCTENVQFTNNLYVNGTFRPQETFSNKFVDFPENDDALFPGGIITKLGPKGVWLIRAEAVDLAGTIIDMHANNIYWTSDVTDYWDSVGLVKPYIWSYETSQAIIDTVNAYFEEKLEFVNAPAVPMFAFKHVADSCVKMQGNTSYKSPPSPYYGWDWWNPDLSPTFDLCTRDNMDMSYNTDAVSYTAGDDGFPLGDLNWFPDKYKEWKNMTSVNEPLQVASQKFQLLQNYPNPFNPSTIIKYRLYKSCNVLLKIYNISGHEVETLMNKFQTSGEHKITWQPKGLPNGIYFYKLQTGTYSETKKLILQK